LIFIDSTLYKGGAEAVVVVMILCYFFFNREAQRKTKQKALFKKKKKKKVKEKGSLKLFNSIKKKVAVNPPLLSISLVQRNG
jgi:H+/gluconate symporter-like permease